MTFKCKYPCYACGHMCVKMYCVVCSVTETILLQDDKGKLYSREPCPLKEKYFNEDSMREYKRSQAQAEEGGSKC
jgi:hypothetical protein